MSDDRTRPSVKVRLRLVQVLGRYQLMIQGYAYGICGDHHLAEDVYQEVAAIAAAKGDDLPDDGGIAPWLREVTRRKALELVRKAKRMPLLSDEVIEALGPAIEAAEEDEGARLRSAMAECIEKLPDDGRAVIQGRYRDELSCEAIADHVGRSVQGVYGMLKRLKVALARCVEKAVAG